MFFYLIVIKTKRLHSKNGADEEWEVMKGSYCMNKTGPPQGETMQTRWQLESISTSGTTTMDFDPVWIQGWGNDSVPYLDWHHQTPNGVLSRWISICIAIRFDVDSH